MEKLDDDDDMEIKAPLNMRYVFVGLAMLIFGLASFVFIENIWAKYFGLFCFSISFFVMTKKAKDNLQ